MRSSVLWPLVLAACSGAASNTTHAVPPPPEQRAPDTDAALVSAAPDAASPAPTTPNAGPAQTDSLAQGPAPSSDCAPGVVDGDERILVGREDGLHLVGLDGAVLRTLRAGPALYPRRVPNTRDVVFLSGAEVHRYSLERCEDRVVARLPPAPGGRCSAELQRLGGAFHAVPGPTGVALDPAGTHWCLRGGDYAAGHVRMTEVVYQVDLARGAVRYLVDTGTPARCHEAPSRPAPDVCARDVPWGTPASTAGPQRDDAALPFRLDGARVLRGESVVVAMAGGAPAILGVSPSSRWVLFRLDEPESAEGASELDRYVLDRATGQVFFLSPRGLGESLPHETLTSAERLGAFSGGMRTDELEPEVWLHTHGAFVLHGNLVVPGRPLVELHGTALVLR